VPGYRDAAALALVRIQQPLNLSQHLRRSIYV
jgi:hypothetical protein